VARSLSAIAPTAVSLLALALVTAGYLWLAANPTTVALTYLLSIVLIATWWGIGPATIASVAAIVAFNVLFLPPVGTLTIADPQNWVSFFAFLAVAVIVSQLSGRARDRQVEAIHRQEDLERLYALSRALLLADGETSLTAQLARRVAETFSVAPVALFDPRTGAVAWGGAADRPEIEPQLRDVARTGEVVRGDHGLVITPVRLGGAPIGSLAIGGGSLGDAVLQSIANLVAIGLERARGQEAVAASEAARQSGELRAAILDSVAHEFKTPLTAGKAAASALLSSAQGNPNDHELVVIINEELDRMQALVSDAIHMLRIDAGDVAVHRERHHVSEIVAAGIREMAGRLGGHAVTTSVPDALTVDADAFLLRLALRQLLDNAVKYSPPDSRIAVTADGDGRVNIKVTNSGPAISALDRARIFDRFYRGAHSGNIPGSGLGLAIVQRIAQAHGGEAAVTSDAATGTTFTVSVPASSSDHGAHT
jgi:two-component system sensor histidine kinase KdpD